MRYLLVFSTVVITIGTSLILDFTASYSQKLNIVVLTLLGLVVAINFGKFVLWGFIHKKFEVSKSYPITSIFFPLILIVSVIKGESEFTIPHVLGVILIVSGLFLFKEKAAQQ